MSKPVKYNQQVQGWFCENGSFSEHPEENAVFAEWTTQGYRTSTSYEDLSDEWLKHFDLNRGIVEKR